MNNKHTFKKAAALFLGLALSVGATGCGFITTNSQADLEQTVATVDISAKLAKNEKYKGVANDVKEIVGKMSAKVLKRDLVSYYLSTGYQYVEQYGYSYEDTFNMLLDGLISREILIQNAVAYYLEKFDDVNLKACNDFVAAELTAIGAKDAKLAQMIEDEHKEVLVLKYFLSIEDKENKDYKQAEYNLKKSLNESLDSMEASYITAVSDDHEHEEPRTLPTGVDTEKEDYIPENYEVYTGRNAAGACGDYKIVEGSTVTTRQKAYNAFLTNLQAYNLINVKKGEAEDTRDITKLHYYYVELSSMLGQSLINKYFESLESDVSETMSATYVQAKYDEMLAQQTHDYATDDAAFSSALDSVAEGSYLLYGLKDYGFVSSILIPFSTAQNIEYKQAEGRGLTENELFVVRNSIAKNIKAEDLRDTWISEDEHSNYSYEKDGKTYFFEENFAENSKYEPLKHYAGNYAYNEEKIDIDEFISTFENYIESVSGVNAEGQKKTDFYYYNTATESYESTDDFYKQNEFRKLEENKDTKKLQVADGSIDYSKFTYYTGKVQFENDDVKSADFLNRESKQYKALSAVNELLFAYSTDPGSLNSYMGYAISPYTTNFVKEYEAAAQDTVARGVGAYSVSVNQYGWHIVYCTFKFDGGEVYGGYKDAEKDVEGTFSNLFYETIKEAAYNNHATEEQNRAIKEFDVSECVNRIKKNYKDLLEMDK